MKITGTNRLRYSKLVETAPSRFSDPEAYAAWALRADAWAEANA